MGRDFGVRYHIMRAVGTGGMGAVYQAWDKALEVPVAIKVIRPEASANRREGIAAGKRFKRELLLARQVTHRNVVRIHDFGEVDGTTYITMPYIEGSDLRTILKRQGPLPLERVLRIARQVASGLAAAHRAGVIHRDLKPANIMLDADDHALIMDFGCARSVSIGEDGLTFAGAAVGTLGYMAPEQLRGAPVDHRADIYAFGWILRDMLSPGAQRGAGRASPERVDQVQPPTPPIRDVNPATPTWLEALIARCLQTDRTARWQSVTDLLVALEHPPAEVESNAAAAAPPPRSRRLRYWKLAPTIALLVAIAAGYFAWRRFTAPVPAISVAVLPFRNASGDPTLDSLGPILSEALATMIGHSSRTRTLAPERVHDVLRNLRIAPHVGITAGDVERFADHVNAQQVISGQITRVGERIRIDTALQDLANARAVSLYPVAAEEPHLLSAISELATRAQGELGGGSADALGQLKSSAWRPSTNSFDAFRKFMVGRGLMRQGTHRLAADSFKAAIAADGNFALALSALAQIYSALGLDSEAAEVSRQAMALGDKLPALEKYRIAASHYMTVGDTAQALESYRHLLVASPGDVMTRFQLALLCEQSQALDEARQLLSTVVDADPKYVEALLALGRVEIKRGQAHLALRPLQHARSLATEQQGHQAMEDILQALGIAHKQLNRLHDAMGYYQESLEMKRLLDDQRGMAASLSEIGQIQARLGDSEAAIRSFEEAVRLRRTTGDVSGTGMALTNLASIHNDKGQTDTALTLFHEALQIGRDIGNHALEAQCLNAIGAIHYHRGRFEAAETSFWQALALREKLQRPWDVADALHNLGQATIANGRFDEALGYYLRAFKIRRDRDVRAAAVELFSAAHLHERQGRFGASVQAARDAHDAFRRFNDRGLKSTAGLIALGTTLSRSGDPGAGGQVLEEAIRLAGELKDPALVAEATAAEGERLFLAGDAKAARSKLVAALREATKAANRPLMLEIRVILEKTSDAVSEARAAALADLAAESAAAGLVYPSLEATLMRTETLIQLRQLALAQSELEQVRGRIEEQKLRVLQAKVHTLQARLFLTGASDAEARRESAAAVRLLEQLGSEAGNQKLLDRSDLSAIYRESLKGAAG